MTEALPGAAQAAYEPARAPRSLRPVTVEQGGDQGDRTVPPSDTAAIVLAGGAGRRMGGADKAALRVGGLTLLDRVLDAARPLCAELVVVGPRRHTEVPGVAFVQERAPGGGPVPAVLAGLAATRGDVVLALATDLALLRTVDLSRLLAALRDDPDLDAVAALDERPAPNPLLAAYRRHILERVERAGPGPGTPAAALLAGRVDTVELGLHATCNVNRPADLRQAEALLWLAT